jgi:hypothetical protein
MLSQGDSMMSRTGMITLMDNKSPPQDGAANNSFQ